MPVTELLFGDELHTILADPHLGNQQNKQYSKLFNPTGKIDPSADELPEVNVSNYITRFTILVE